MQRLRLASALLAMLGLVTTAHAEVTPPSVSTSLEPSIEARIADALKPSRSIVEASRIAARADDDGAGRNVPQDEQRPVVPNALAGTRVQRSCSVVGAVAAFAIVATCAASNRCAATPRTGPTPNVTPCRFDRFW